MPGAYTSAYTRELIVKMWREGKKTTREIGDFFKVSHSTVVRILQRLRQRLSLTNAKKKGRPRKTSRQDDSMIRRLSVANPFLPATSINAEMNNRYGISVANTTIRSRLRASGLLARHAAKKPFISAKNRVARLAFAREHLHWTVLQWKQILWSDESRFQLFRSDGLHYVRRPIGHRFTPRFLQPTVKHVREMCSQFHMDEHIQCH
jgi:transposase